MHKHVLIASFAALCVAGTISTAGATPIAPVKADVAFVEKVNFGGYGFKHRGFGFRKFYKPFAFTYPYSYGFVGDYYPNYGFYYGGYPRFGHFRRHYF